MKSTAIVVMIMLMMAMFIWNLSLEFRLDNSKPTVTVKDVDQLDKIDVELIGLLNKIVTNMENHIVDHVRSDHTHEQPIK